MTGPTTFGPAAFPTPARRRLLRRLAAMHAEEAFSPCDVRETARRVVAAVADLGLSSVIVRGALDLGGAELDHLFVVIDDHVVDVALPVRAAPFVAVVRGWVAGDVGRDELVDRAASYGLEDRVVGEFPDRMRYRGAPLWGSAA